MMTMRGKQGVFWSEVYGGTPPPLESVKSMVSREFLAPMGDDPPGQKEKVRPPLDKFLKHPCLWLPSMLIYKFK